MRQLTSRKQTTRVRCLRDALPCPALPGPALFWPLLPFGPAEAPWPACLPACPPGTQSRTSHGNSTTHSPKPLGLPLHHDPAVVTGVQVHNWGQRFDDGSPNLEFVAPSSVCVVVNGETTHLDLHAIPVSGGQGARGAGLMEG